MSLQIEYSKTEKLIAKLRKVAAVILTIYLRLDSVILDPLPVCLEQLMI